MVKIASASNGLIGSRRHARTLLCWATFQQPSRRSHVNCGGLGVQSSDLIFQPWTSLVQSSDSQNPSVCTRSRSYGKKTCSMVVKPVFDSWRKRQTEIEVDAGWQWYAYAHACLRNDMLMFLRPQPIRLLVSARAYQSANSIFLSQ